MKERRLYIGLISVFMIPFFSFDSLSYPQSQKIDSILEQSSQLVYDNPNESIDLAFSVYESTEYGVKTKVKALTLLSLAYTSKRNYQKALEYIKKADELSKPLEDKKLQIEILFKIGILYQQLKIFDKSIEYLEKTEQMALLYPNRKAVSRYIANSYAVKGFIYKDNLNCDIALEFFDRSIAEYQNVNNGEINTNLSIVYYNKGNCYTLLSEYGKAKNSFNRAIALAELSQAQSLIAFAKKGLASVFTAQGEYQSAIDYLNEALEQSKNVGDIVLNSSIYNGLLENYLALNQWEAYQKYYRFYSKSQLEIKIAERNSVSDSLEDNEIRKNEYQAELQNQTSNRLKVVLLLLILIFISVFFIEKKNRKTIALLQKRIKTLQNQKTDT
ncbi:tetratricopeptide repeat protein [Winogradskyella costae]|uniref:tetratricopeptide repeat protein n=1 Tax=Winogradskyella costae TaxID=2697008 RepID=UPI0015C87BA1|nr:tetratricopeptide repeat protein [Winogradskyella costae]